MISQIDILENPWFNNVVVLQSVLSDVRKKNSTVYGRIRNLVSNETRSFFVFCNEHKRETFVEESSECRERQSIHKAAAFYAEHLSIPVLVISDDEQLSKELGNVASVYTIHEFVSKECPDLVELIAQVNPQESKDSVQYEEHLSASAIAAEPDRYKIGNLTCTKYNEGYVNINNENIRISGSANLNRAIHGDQVAIELIGKSNQMEVDDDKNEALQGEEEEEDDDEYDTSTFTATTAKQARVVSVLKRNTRAYCGSIGSVSNLMKQDTTTRYHTLLFSPIDKKIPKIRIRIRNPMMLSNKRFVVNVDSWPTSSKYPLGHFVKMIGDIGDKETESQVLLIEHDVPFLPFTPAVLACLPEQGPEWKVSEADLPNRKDLRHLDVCSIDPPGCTDIDDALHALRLPNGNIQVGVHIADVSHFVKANTPMDEEATRRGTTVYLVDKRIDMLPSLLGTNLCSLHSNVDRLAFSVLWEMTPAAQVVSVEYTKSIIRSRASFTYDAAQERLVDPKATDSISQSIKMLDSIAKILRKQRMEAGALTLSSPEVRFKLENDSQDPVDVEMKQLKDTNALVEEFMLLANIYVARKIYSHFPESSVLRRHPAPPASNFMGLQKSLKRFDLDIDPSTSKTLSQSLDKCVLSSDAYLNTLVRIVTTRCMYQAVYFSSGTLAEQEFHHYGLCTEMYTHFTSPIRRYADLVVHRLLAACIGYDKSYTSDLVNKTRMKQVSDNLNYRHRNAQHASRACVQLYTNLYFKDKNITEDAYVVSVFDRGVSVLIPKYGVENVIVLQKEYPSLQYDADKGTLNVTTQDDKTTLFYVFKKVKVSVVGMFDDVGKRSKVVCSIVM